MTSDALLVLRALFSMIWSLFTSWHIPGTATTPAAFAMFILVVALVLRSIRSILNSSSGTPGDKSER